MNGLENLNFYTGQTQQDLPANLKALHERAVVLSQQYKDSEAELLAAIIEGRERKIYRYFDCTSIFEYCVKILRLDPGLVYGFTAVAKKIKEVPELQEKIAAGEINVSTAKRITSVLTAENKSEWFAKAESLPVRKLEKEVAKANPRQEVPERASYLTSKRVRLELGIDEDVMLKLRRAQDLESQRQKIAVSLEGVLGVMVDLYLNKHDPTEKAKRAKICGKLEEKSANTAVGTEEAQNIQSTSRVKNSSTWKEATRRRSPIPQKTLHQVQLRDLGRCQHFNSYSGEKCQNTRFLEIHHKVPLSAGGSDELQNLITLCSEHHKMEHHMQ